MANSEPELTATASECFSANAGITLEAVPQSQWLCLEKLTMLGKGKTNECSSSSLNFIQISQTKVILRTLCQKSGFFHEFADPLNDGQIPKIPSKPIA